VLNFKNAQDFLTELQNSEIGRSLLRHRESAQRADRQILVDQLRATHQESEDAVTKFTAAVAPLAKAHRDAVEKEQAAARKLLAKRGEWSSAVHTLDGRIDQLERELRIGADPRIDDALSALTARVEAIGRDGFRMDTIPADGIDMSTLRPLKKIRTNAASMGRIWEAVRAARHQLEMLKLENPEDVAAAIAEIHDSVPWSSAYEVTEVA
jgi:hypothetical protein